MAADWHSIATAFDPGEISFAGLEKSLQAWRQRFVGRVIIISSRRLRCKRVPRISRARIEHASRNTVFNPDSSLKASGMKMGGRAQTLTAHPCGGGTDAWQQAA